MKTPSAFRGLLTGIVLMVLPMLAGCFISAGPLFDAKDVATPLPDEFVLARVDTAGQPTNERDGYYLVERNGSAYKVNSPDGTFEIQLHALKDANFVVAIQAIYGKDGQKINKDGKVYYGILTVQPGKVEFIPPEALTGLSTALASAGISYKIDNIYMVFTDQAEMRRGALIALYELPQQSRKNYRIVTDPVELEKLLAAWVAHQKSEAAKATAAPKQPPAATPPASATPSFSSAGFEHPEFIQAVYDGAFGTMKRLRSEVYLAAFVGMFIGAREDAPGCKQAVSPGAAGKIAGSAGAENLGGLVESFMGMHKGPSTGRDDAFARGARAGGNFFGNLMAAQAAGEADARRFYGRYRCIGPVASRFFGNIERYAFSR